MHCTLDLVVRDSILICVQRALWHLVRLLHYSELISTLWEEHMHESVSNMLDFIMYDSASVNIAANLQCSQKMVCSCRQAQRTLFVCTSGPWEWAGLVRIVAVEGVEDTHTHLCMYSGMNHLQAATLHGNMVHSTQNTFPISRITVSSKLYVSEHNTTLFLLAMNKWYTSQIYMTNSY